MIVGCMQRYALSDLYLATQEGEEHRVKESSCELVHQLRAALLHACTGTSCMHCQRGILSMR